MTLHSHAEAWPVTAKAEKTRILLIEDNRTDVVLTSRMLKGISLEEIFDITDVPRMAEALRLLDEKPFDVVLLDLNLLDVDGIATVCALHTENPDIPIIVYSGSNDMALKKQALICGAKHYLVKGRESAFSLKFMIEQALVH